MMYQKKDENNDSQLKTEISKISLPRIISNRNINNQSSSQLQITLDLTQDQEYKKLKV